MGQKLRRILISTPGSPQTHRFRFGRKFEVAAMMVCWPPQQLALKHAVTIRPQIASSSPSSCVAGLAVLLSLPPSFKLLGSGNCQTWSLVVAKRGRPSNGHRWAATRIISNSNSPEYGIKNSHMECSGCTWELRAKGGMDIVEVGLLTEEDEIAAAQQPEEILPRETRLKGIQGIDDCNGVPISSHIWEWRHRWHVHYEKAGQENNDAPALLLLPGFGVGSFHYDHQLRELGQEYRVWAMDFLGQGNSWPSHDPTPASEQQIEVVEGQVKVEVGDWGFGKTVEPWAQELVYSVDTWRDQVQAFVEEVIGGSVYVVGNSLGGYVGTYFAATRPDLVKGITLLNATPFWAFIPNARRYPLLARVVPWAGLGPVPVFAKIVTQVWWNFLRKPQFIRRLLELVYADRTVIDDKLVMHIIKATDHPAAAAAFASILFAPRAHTDFGENLIRLKDDKIPLCMIYGREDPWVVPFWGRRAKQRNPNAIYYELSPAGHCPHHEVPEVVNDLLRKWVESIQSQGTLSPALHKASAPVTREHLFVVEYSHDILQEKEVSVQIKGHQGFLRDWWDSIIEMFSKQRLRL